MNPANSKVRFADACTRYRAARLRSRFPPELTAMRVPLAGTSPLTGRQPEFFKRQGG